MSDHHLSSFLAAASTRPPRRPTTRHAHDSILWVSEIYDIIDALERPHGNVQITAEADKILVSLLDACVSQEQTGPIELLHSFLKCLSIEPLTETSDDDGKRQAGDVDAEEDQVEERADVQPMDNLIPVLESSDIQIYFTAASASSSDEGEVDDLTVSDKDE